MRQPRAVVRGRCVAPRRPRRCTLPRPWLSSQVKSPQSIGAPNPVPRRLQGTATLPTQRPVPGVHGGGLAAIVTACCTSLAIGVDSALGASARCADQPVRRALGVRATARAADVGSANAAVRAIRVEPRTRGSARRWRRRPSRTPCPRRNRANFGRSGAARAGAIDARLVGAAVRVRDAPDANPLHLVAQLVQGPACHIRIDRRRALGHRLSRSTCPRHLTPSRPRRLHRCSRPRSLCRARRRPLCRRRCCRLFHRLPSHPVAPAPLPAPGPVPPWALLPPPSSPDPPLTSPAASLRSRALAIARATTLLMDPEAMASATSTALLNALLRAPIHDSKPRILARADSAERRRSTRWPSRVRRTRWTVLSFRRVREGHVRGARGSGSR